MTDRETAARRYWADWLTAARAILLPVPIAMLYQRTIRWDWAALGVFILIGLTDVFDGRLARRYGSTRLGAAMDGAVDRIFVLAAYAVLADIGALPAPAVTLLIGRELVMSQIRGLSPSVAPSPFVDASGKLGKTGQMVGAGVILACWLLPTDREVTILLGLLALTEAVIFLARRAARGNHDWKSASGAVLFGVLWVVSALAGGAVSIMAVMTAVVALSLFSGLAFAWAERGEIRAALAHDRWNAARLVAVGVTSPAVFAALVHTDAWAGLLAGAIACCEATSAGFTPVPRRAGLVRYPRLDVVRSTVIAVLAVPGRLWPGAPVAPLLAMGPWLAFLVSFANTVHRLYRTAKTLTD
jgi:CDP-diacylglycerol--glycerol-3-phosphate 3-phosphatidyltransferase